MIPVYQDKFDHDGNCLPACLATLFEEPLSAWDRCSARYSDWEAVLERELNHRGYTSLEVIFSGGLECRGLKEGTEVILVHNWTETTSEHAHAIIGRFAGYDEGHMLWEVIHDPCEPIYPPGYPPIYERDYQIEAMLLLVPCKSKIRLDRRTVTAN